MKLFHVSEAENIAEFVPRYSIPANQAVVWAIAEFRLANYLLPRDCPRVCFSAGEKSIQSDRQRFLGSSEQAIAIESVWYEKAFGTTLYLYEMPNAGFTLFDSVAGYYVSNRTVIPLQQCIVKQPIMEILSRKIELRILPSLWHLYDEVINSTLNFSAIRMNNAQPRT